MVLNLTLKLSIDNLNYKKFSATNIKGNLIYKPGLFSLNRLRLTHWMAIFQEIIYSPGEPESPLYPREIFTLAGIDINKAFITFNKFDQDFVWLKPCRISVRIPVSYYTSGFVA